MKSGTSLAHRQFQQVLEAELRRLGAAAVPVTSNLPVVATAQESTNPADEWARSVMQAKADAIDEADLTKDQIALGTQGALDELLSLVLRIKSDVTEKMSRAPLQHRPPESVRNRT